MNKIVIASVSQNDIHELLKISQQTFIQTFSDLNTEEDMRKYIDENLSFDRLLVELKDIDSQFYFALFDNHIIGYLKLNFGQSQTELKEDNGIEIERIYVLKEYQGKKIGHLLFEKAIHIAQERKADYIWLGVWEENLKAIEFYKKKGFVEFNKHVFKLGDDEQTDIMMKLELRNV